MCQQQDIADVLFENRRMVGFQIGHQRTSRKNANISGNQILVIILLTHCVELVDFQIVNAIICFMKI